MTGKIVLKKLSSSDLTIFEYQYRNTSGAKQKAINLDAAVFINTLFPGLPNRLGFERDRVIVSLTIYGPGLTQPHLITRKILKQQKNWRLNGELISNPPEEVGRYDTLQKGDYAVIEFHGDIEPNSARMYLFSRNKPEDLDIFTFIEEKYGHLFSSHKGMEQIDQSTFSHLLEKITPPHTNPIFDLLDSDALEDVALSGITGFSRLLRQRKSRGVSNEELLRAKKNAEQIGRLGEEIVNVWLEKNGDKEYDSYCWESSNNAISPFDFSLFKNGSLVSRVEVKSTRGSFSNRFHISLAEVLEIVHSETRYLLFRIFEINDTSAKLKIAECKKEYFSNLLSMCSVLPASASVDSFSIDPEALDFDNEITINTDIESP